MRHRLRCDDIHEVGRKCDLDIYDLHEEGVSMSSEKEWREEQILFR